MGSPSQYSLSGASLRGKVHPDVADAIESLQKQAASLQKALTDVKGSVDLLPTLDQIQTLQQTLAAQPGYDLVTHGSSSGLTNQASSLPYVSGKFAYTSTTTSITWYWDGTNGSTLLTINLPDGSFIKVPPASVSVTGLTPTTSYIFYPYFNLDLNAMSFNPTSDGVGTPAIAYSAASLIAATAQSLDNRFAMNADTMTASTTTSGSGGGSGGGTGGTCVREDTSIVPLYGRAFLNKLPAEDWVEMKAVGGIKLVAVPKHRIFTVHGLLPMDKLELGMEIVTRRGASRIHSLHSFKEKAQKVAVWIPAGHLYWSGDVLSHNVKKQT